MKKLKREVHGSLDMKARKRMRKELRNNIVTFKFRKRNGEIRTAHGTLHPDYLPKLRGGAPRPEKQMVYYDLDKEGWRSFRSFTFIKILNIKAVDPTAIPKAKAAKEEEEEEVKKIVPKKEEEKEMEKEVHTEEKKEKKKVHEIDDEIEDDDDKKSVLDDKETPEEEEVIKKDKEIEKEEKGEDEEKDDDEKKKTNESVAPVQEYPNVKTLGDGEYDGILWGHCFLYEDQKYYSEIGWMNMFPGYCKMIIEGDEVFPKPVDKYQRESLKKLFL